MIDPPLIIAQCVNGVECGGFAGRQEAEHDTNGGRSAEGDVPGKNEVTPRCHESGQDGVNDNGL